MTIVIKKSSTSLDEIYIIFHTIKTNLKWKEAGK